MKELVNTSSDPMDSYENDEIPESWERKKLKEIFAWSNGKSLPKKNIDQGEFPVFGGNGINGYHSKYLIEKDCLVIGRVGADCGNVHLAPKKSWVTDNAIYTSGYPEATDLKFYYLLLKNLKLNSLSGGSGQPFISQTVLDEICVAVPPLSEQQRIVARVEALLSLINAARDQLSRVPLLMKRFRQAVLAAACSGRLTEWWREENPSIETSDQLIDHVSKELQNSSVKSKKNSMVQLTQCNAPEPLELFEIPENWAWIAFKDTTSLMQYGISVKSDSDEKYGIPILRMGNIQAGSIDLTDLKFIPQNTESISNFIVETGDILFNRTNSPELVGKSAVYNENLQAVFASYLVRVRPNSNLILSDYLCWWINSMWGREWARNIRTDGVSQSNINAQKLSVMPVPLPPLAEQYEIVRRVGLLFERADAFDQEVAAAGRRCERLTQAVLGKAFSGKL